MTRVDRRIETTIANDLESAVREADIVSCATLSATPLIRGKWLKKGAHLDLVGAYTPKMRESDDECVRRARVYVDTRAGAPKEGGDIAQPLKSGVLKKDAIRGDLYELCRGKAKGRTSRDQVTFYRNVGNQGLQFSSVGGFVYEQAVKRKVGREIPTEWFLQDIRD